MKVISIKQPWASLIITENEQNKGFGIKPIENRTWPCPKKYIGERVLVHASKVPVKIINPNNLFTWQQWEYMNNKQKDLAVFNRLLLGAIIGSVEIVDCVINHKSIWAEKSEFSPYDGPNGEPNEGFKPIYNWVLANPVKFETPIPAKGKLSFWESGIEICHICGQPTGSEFQCERCGEFYCEEHKAFTHNYKCCSLCEYPETV